MTMEYQAFAIDEIKADEDSYTFAGFASVFNVVDSQKDIVLPGAFTRTIKDRKADDVRLLWQHDTSQPIGKLTAMREETRGLYVEGKLSRTPRGMEAYTLLKDGVLKSMSIGYTPRDYDIDPRKGIRQLKSVDLWEVSLVTFPANDKANVTQVKSRPETIREFEHFLREAGNFSQKDATTIALQGFKALTTPGEPDEEVEKALHAITNATNMLKGLTA